MLPPAASAIQSKSKSDKKKKAVKHSRDSLVDELDSIPTEKAKFAKLAEIAKANKPSDSPKKKPKSEQSQKQQPTAVKKKEDKGEMEQLSPQFPHAGDLERIGAMLKMTLEANWRAQLPETDERRLIRDEMGLSQHAAAVTKRLGMFSRQLRDALVVYFTERGNTAMADVVKQLQHCTVHLFPHPKVLIPEKPAVCIWSGKVITEPSCVRAIALVPRKKELEDKSASFHMHLDHVVMLKVFFVSKNFVYLFQTKKEQAIYTAMFFSHIAAAELATRFSKAPFIANDWQDYLVKPEKVSSGNGTNGKKDGLVGEFLERAPKQLSGAVALFATFLPAETFIVKTQGPPGAATPQ